MDKKLIITLKSDLCAATGDGFSSSIDIDVCLDEKGIPYIPGRRIKGCLREAATEIGCENLDAIFGKPGQSKAGCIRVGTAYISDYQAVKEAVTAGGFPPTAVTRAFTYVRAQTAIEDDSVKDGSLRFLRVVKHYAPISEDESKELSFEASISFDEEYEQDVIRAAKALRNIGHRRNRGMGAIRCEIVNDSGTVLQKDQLVKHFEGGIAYAVKLDEPLMIPKQGDESMTYVPGTSVMGFFAGKAAKKHGTEVFEELFLSDKLRFSPLYPVDENDARALPAFGLIAKIKGAQKGTDDGRIVNLEHYLAENKGVPKSGEQPKPLKSGFIGASSFYPLDLKTEVIYHHSTGRATGSDPTLYTQECLSAGQVLAGFVTGPEDLLSLIEQVLQSEKLTFGRSKTAQYSACRLAPYSGSGASSGPIATKPGEQIIALLDSDVLLDNGFGGYTNDAGKLMEAVCLTCDGTRTSHDLASFRYRIVGGYNAKWNQKKPTVRAFAAGSFFVFKASGSAVPSEITIGERRTEGFGRVILLKASEIVPSEPKPIDSVPRIALGDENEWKSLFEKEAKTERLRTATLDYVATCKLLKDLVKEPSFIGRVLLMATQATGSDDFDKRVKSIKTDDKRKIIQKIVNGLRETIGPEAWNDEQECLKLLLSFAKYRAKKSKEGDAR